MGLFRLVARVGRWRVRATCPLEEWPHRRFGAGQNPAYRPSGKFPLQTGGADGAPLGGAVMVKQKRSDDWGFPRWRPYGAKSRDAARVRLCDREGCDEAGDRPAPKAPHSRDRWYFCQAHAAEYNKNWDYFAGLSAEEAAAREANETRGANGFRQSAQWSWGGPGDGTRSRDEMRALDALELESDAEFQDVKSAYRRLAKANHPDLKPGDEEAAKRFQQVQVAYEVLRKAEERREAKAG